VLATLHRFECGRETADFAGIGRKQVRANPPRYILFHALRSATDKAEHPAGRVQGGGRIAPAISARPALPPAVAPAIRRSPRRIQINEPRLTLAVERVPPIGRVAVGLSAGQPAVRLNYRRQRCR
jgi:hypothetical protein